MVASATFHNAPKETCMAASDQTREAALRERIRQDVADTLDEELELELDDHRLDAAVDDAPDAESRYTIDRRVYFKELFRLQGELVKLQDWVQHEKRKVVVLFEGRDSAGKGGAIKRITQRLNPRVCRVAALPAPNERERTQWYFQRYVAHLPAAGEMVLFDRSWYNRAGVEHVMGFCTESEYEEFLHSCPEFERILGRAGIMLIKYWFSVSDEEQERRFRSRIHTPSKRWKLSPMDLESRRHWADYSRAKGEMCRVRDTNEAPWFVVNAENKKCARLNVIRHLLSMIPYRDLTPAPLKLPSLDKSKYVRPPIQEQNFIPQVYSSGG